MAVDPRELEIYRRGVADGAAAQRNVSYAVDRGMLTQDQAENFLQGEKAHFEQLRIDRGEIGVLVVDVIFPSGVWVPPIRVCREGLHIVRRPA